MFSNMFITFIKTLILLIVTFRVYSYEILIGCIHVCGYTRENTMHFHENTLKKKLKELNKTFRNRTTKQIRAPLCNKKKKYHLCNIT